MADPVRRVLALVPLLGALAVLGVVPLPMYVVGPGPARDVIPLIRIEGRQIYPPRGQLLLTTVALEHSTTLEAVAGWLDAYQDVVPERLILPPGVTPQEDDAIQRSAMDESKLTAAAVALRRVTAYPQERGVGALVSRVEPGTLADGVLFSGDLIVSIDSRPVRAPGDVEAALLRIDAEREVMLRIRVDDGFRSVRLSRARAVAALGRVELIEAFPFPLVIESGDIGGPSAGLMWAVGLVDLLTPGDLTAGRRIAGTGTIDPRGVVGPIGGIGQKIVAAELANAEAFLVPRGDFHAARSVGSGLELVPVDDLEDALVYLQSTCGCSPL